MIWKQFYTAIKSEKLMERVIELILIFSMKEKNRYGSYHIIIMYYCYTSFKNV